MILSDLSKFKTSDNKHFKVVIFTMFLCRVWSNGIKVFLGNLWNQPKGSGHNFGMYIPYSLNIYPQLWVACNLSNFFTFNVVISVHATSINRHSEHFMINAMYGLVFSLTLSVWIVTLTGVLHECVSEFIPGIGSLQV